ncbi:MAG TPA: hypothetical protein VH110_09995, partial [Candidatus Acidoferrum sp.]|nr:hypothetical protein [Candidatus Acidoferrum sp.]
KELLRGRMRKYSVEANQKKPARRWASVFLLERRWTCERRRGRSPQRQNTNPPHELSSFVTAIGNPDQIEKNDFLSNVFN